MNTDLAVVCSSVSCILRRLRVIIRIMEISSFQDELYGINLALPPQFGHHS